MERYCPNCGADLVDNIRHTTNSAPLFTLDLDDHGDLEYLEVDCEEGDASFYCHECAEDIDLSEKQVKELLMLRKENLAFEKS